MVVEVGNIKIFQRGALVCLHSLEALETCRRGRMRRVLYDGSERSEGGRSEMFNRYATVR